MVAGPVFRWHRLPPPPSPSFPCPCYTRYYQLSRKCSYHQSRKGTWHLLHYWRLGGPCYTTSITIRLCGATLHTSTNEFCWQTVYYFCKLLAGTVLHKGVLLAHTTLLRRNAVATTPMLWLGVLPPPLTLELLSMLTWVQLTWAIFSYCPFLSELHKFHATKPATHQYCFLSFLLWLKLFIFSHTVHTVRSTTPVYLYFGQTNIQHIVKVWMTCNLHLPHCALDSPVQQQELDLFEWQSPHQFAKDINMTSASGHGHHDDLGQWSRTSWRPQ